MNENIELQEIARALQKYWIWILVSVILGGGVGIGISRLQDPVYQAKTSVLVGQISQVDELSRDQIAAGQILVQTYAVLIRRQPVLQQVIRELEIDKSWQSLREDIGVSIIPETQIIEITADAGSREEAESIAAEITNQLIKFSTENSQPPGDSQPGEFINNQLVILQERIFEGQEQLVVLREQLEGNVEGGNSAEIENEILVLERLITDWETNYTDLLAVIKNSQSQPNVFLIDQAEARNRPIRPNTRLNVIIGVGFGFLAAAGFIVFRLYADQTVKTSYDLQTIFGVELLGSIPELTGKDFHNKTALDKGFPRHAQESFQVILNNFTFITKLNPPKTVLISSPDTGEGKSMTSVNLAIYLAITGQKVILVDADFRFPVLHKIYKLENRKGFGDLLWPDEREFEDYLQPTSIENLKLLPSGNDPINPAARLRSRQMDELMNYLKNAADIIVFDGPPIASIADGLVLSSMVDGVIMVGSIGKTRNDVARRAMENLRIANAKLIGFVTNRVSQKSFAYFN